MLMCIDDVLKLYNDYRVSVCNCVDLSLFARTVDNARWQGKYNHPLGLARLIESYEYRLLVKGKITRSNWEAVLNERQQECQYQILFLVNRHELGHFADASNDAHAGFSLYRRFKMLLPLLPTPPQRGWYSFDAINGRLCRQDGTQWYAENPNYDPGPPPPPRLPREIKASMIITTKPNADSENNGEQLEPSATKANKNENRFQRRRRDRNYLAPLSTSQQPPAGSASGSTQQLQPRDHGNEHNPQPLPKNSGNTISQHRPTGAQGASSTQRREPSSNIRNEQAQTDNNGYPRRRTRRRPRHPASQDTATATRS